MRRWRCGRWRGARATRVCLEPGLKFSLLLCSCDLAGLIFAQRVSGGCHGDDVVRSLSARGHRIDKPIELVVGAGWQCFWLDHLGWTHVALCLLRDTLGFVLVIDADETKSQPGALNGGLVPMKTLGVCLPRSFHSRLERFSVNFVQILTHNGGRSEEHTSELQSRGHLVCRLL